MIEILAFCMSSILIVCTKESLFIIQDIRNISREAVWIFCYCWFLFSGEDYICYHYVLFFAIKFQRYQLFLCVAFH
jgi:hypothetical protein